MKQRFQKFLQKSERGQAIILIAFAIIGLVAMVGLVTDTGILLIEYGKLKRGVDAASVAAAQQYRLPTSGAATIDKVALVNSARNFLQLNQSDMICDTEPCVIVNSCEDEPDEFVDSSGDGIWQAGETLTVDWNGNGVFDTNRPLLCNPDPIGHPNDNRKLVEVVAQKNVFFGFLRVIGIDQTTITARSTGEAATIDLVLVIDTSASMAYETDGVKGQQTGDDPSACNPTNTCQPLRKVKQIAQEFLDTLYFPYDRVAIVTMTSQTPEGSRDPLIVLPLSSDKDTVLAQLGSLKVYQPRVCDGTDTPGTCLDYNDTTGAFEGANCETYGIRVISPIPEIQAATDPSSCPSSNVGGALKRAGEALTLDPDPRLDAFWVVVSLLGGPANTTFPDDNTPPNYPNGFCPQYTWPPEPYWNWPFCRDARPSVRHHDTDPLVPYVNWVTGIEEQISYYDADDYARDQADNLATAISGEGITIFTIGLGAQVRDITTVEAGELPPGEALFQYIAECAGENSPDDCATPVTNPQINHGQYFYAPDSNALTQIFHDIAQNIATKISQ